MSLLLVLLVGCLAMVAFAAVLERFTSDEMPRWLSRFL